jgi:mRNA-degrading endonuclease RelE of RelBE toxin-antitoxin system
VPEYHILLSKRAFKFLESVDSKTRQLVISDLESLIHYPDFDKSLDLSKLEGQKKGYFRLRTGKIRTIFAVDEISKAILVRKIAYREAAYE